MNLPGARIPRDFHGCGCRSDVWFPLWEFARPLTATHSIHSL
jgi:hypothetical protein